MVGADEVVDGGPDAETEVDAGAIERVGEIADRLPEFLLAGDAAGDLELAADAVGGLEECHAVAASTELDGGRQPGRSGADDGDVSCPPGRCEDEFGLPPGPRVQQAGGLAVDEDVVEAGLVAGDAGVDLVAPALGGLGHPVRVRQHGPGHGDQVGGAVGEQSFRDLGHGDAVGGHHGHPGDVGEATDLVREGGSGDGGDDGGDAGLVPADVGVEQIDARVLELAGQGHHLRPGLPVRDEVRDGEAEHQQEVRPHRRARPAHDLHGQATAVLGRAAPAVRAVVRRRGEELIDQVALAAHDLDAVVTGAPGQQRAPDVGVDLPFDPAIGQAPGAERGDGGLARRRRCGAGVIGVATRVQDLQHDVRALVVHGGGDTAVATRLDPIGQLGRERQQPAAPVRCVPARHDQTDPAAGPLGEVRGELADVVRAVLETGVHRAHHDAVAQRQRADGERGEQGRIPVRLRGVGHARQV